MNYLKTTVLMAALAGLFVMIGQIFGGNIGAILALIFATLMNLSIYWFSDRVVLRIYRAQEIGSEDRPGLYRTVERLARRADLPMPRVYVISGDTPNAFATGRNPQHAAVTVTEGIMQILNKDELEGVIAHELAHIRNRDILISSIAATIAGAITWLAHMAQWAVLFGFGGDDEDEDGNPIAILAMAIIAPVAALIIQMAISRSREYTADHGGAEISGKPLALANALRRLERGVERLPMKANPATAHLFIANPLSGTGLALLFSTHPSMDDRILRLEMLAQQMEQHTPR